ncbi:transglycosylase domain-containing protein [Pedobacter helvus]|uniref:Transglycosylase domain-containing protein n=1 Tax=Pedobacter helvus TaxID=2563444 RepID=A0ABW9JKM9_9SPHI|nr:biosynthetic peptidoglycan transglycosylase [Pedobacter ureilyticus]
MQLPKIRIPKKYVKIGAWVIGILMLVLLAGGAVAYSKREALLNKMVAKAINKAQKDYGLAVKIGEYGFSGLSSVRMNKVSVVPKDRDTLTTIGDITIGVKLFPLLFGDVKLSEVTLTEGKLNLVMRDTLTNIDFILKRKKKDSTTTKSKVNLSELASNLLNQVFYKIPDDMEIKNFMMQLNDNDTAFVKFLTTTATIDGGELKSTIQVNDTAAVWHINGNLDPSDKQLDVMLFADGKKVELPYLENKLHTKINFDTVKTQMKEASFSGDDYKISGSWAIKNLLINQPRISADDIIVPDARVEADMLIGENFVCLDSTSTVYLRNASIHPYLKYTLSPNKIYEMKLNAPEQDAQSIFNSFPVGLFESLDGIKVQGKLKYSLDFHLDTSLPDSVRFSSTLTPTDFKVLQFGKTDLTKINSDFIYTPYEYGKPMRNITIGPSNSNFTRLENISPNFKNALLTAEDPSFFRHRGFVEESIRKSIAVNFKEKKFKRGGSTISMQLVKNVFLSRKKTLVRKAEEILIVWLIENNRLVSKSRMLEVYFNIIEMGNNVYGIGEASRHYFGKTPSELTVGEGIFLANIVPKPKVALYKFMSNGTLKGYLLPYFKYIGNIMARRGLTTPDSTGYGFYDVRLREGLRQYLLPDSTTIDTNAIDIGEDDMMTPEGMQDQSKNLFDRLFGGAAKKDTTKVQSASDTTKTKKQIRQERREERRRQKEEEKNGN